MSLQGKKVTVHDMTLRDGMHPKRHLMTLAQMTTIASGLDAAGVPLIEVRTIVLFDIARANPKSHNFILPFAPIKTFCGFMSRCMILFECRK